MRALSVTTGSRRFCEAGVGLTPYSAAPGRTMSQWAAGPRKMPEELASEVGTPGNAAWTAGMRAKPSDAIDSDLCGTARTPCSRSR